MELRQLRYFLQVYRDGSILKAAQHIAISQQALSKSIALLEQEVGVPLFSRSSRGLTPTETGELLHELSQPIVDAMDILLREISVSAKLNSMQFSVGISQGVEHFVRQRDIDVFCTQNPPVHIAIEERSYDLCEALVENGSWAPVSGKLMREMLGELKGFQVLEPVVSLKSALKDSSLEPLFQLRDRILDSLNG